MRTLRLKPNKQRAISKTKTEQGNPWLTKLALFAMLAAFGCILAPSAAWGLDVIPGLKGFGTDTRAAYGATNDPVIFIVTDLSTNNGTPGDSTRNGTAVKTGSFLEAINYNPPANTGKIILFEVSGTINAVSSPFQVARGWQKTEIEIIDLLTYHWSASLTLNI